MKYCVGPVQSLELDKIFRKYWRNYQTVFIHAGLRDIKQSLQCEPYNFLLDRFKKYFSNILAPGFTPSFRQSGIYHKQFSIPEYGAFSRAYLRDCDYRTNDAIHSILVIGDYRFNKCNHYDSFGEDSCYGKLDRDNVLFCNIGTKWLVSVQLHYIERLLKLPYVGNKQHPGVIYFNEQDFQNIIQTNYSMKIPLKWNRNKLQRQMIKAGILDYYNLNGLQIRFFKARELRLFVERMTKQDPYYLIT